MWVAGNDPDTLEVTCNDESHFFLLKGLARYALPAGHYRVEAYRGLFHTPARAEFDLEAGELTRVELKLPDWTGGAGREWLSGDDHIHLTRSPSDNSVYLGWLAAEDLSVGNFLQLQRQTDAAVQYAFGAPGEATRGGRYTIRPGQESRTEYYGHVNLLGAREIIRPLSAGTMYANSPDVSAYPAVLFAAGRRLGATVGYAHFNGSMPHSTLLMDVANGAIDFVEVFQFGTLKTAEWYELLNAGFRVTGVAGSDFPVPLSRFKAWPRSIPLLGPERTLVKAAPSPDPYTAWSKGVREGRVVVSNGPLVEIGLDAGQSAATATASFRGPLERLEIVRNGEVIALVEGRGERTRLTATAALPAGESCWVAARVVARKEPGEPDIQAHTNPLYVTRDGRPVLLPAAQAALAAKWARELEWYRTAPLQFRSEEARREFFEQGERALKILRSAGS